MSSSAAPRFDDRAIAAGTTVRFVLLAVLIVVATASMTEEVVASHISNWGCLLAAGGDPNNGSTAIFAAMRRQPAAYSDCIARFGHTETGWIPLSAVAVLLLAAILVTVVLTRTRSGRRNIPVEKLSGYADLTPLLRDLVSATGITQQVRFVVDPSALSAGAVVTGRTRRPTVRLHGGLLAHIASEPQRFRAVVLHELGHIYNRDVTVTYSTIALWRAYLVTALLPYLLWAVWWLTRPYRWHSDIPFSVRNLTMTGVIVGLVYLVRADVLRAREVYADRTAVRWGADPRGWVIPDPGSMPNPLRRMAASIRELFVTHPRWAVRRRALDDPAVLFGMFGLPTVATGMAASLISGRMSELALVSTMRPMMVPVSSCAAAALVTGIVGFAVWRATIFAAVTARPHATGLKLGLCLGIGLSLGELVLNRATIADWVPNHPAVLLVPIPIGIFYGLWATQSAGLWVAAWAGRSMRIPFWINIFAGFVVLSALLWWWDDNAWMLTTWMFDADAVQLTGLLVQLPVGLPLRVLNALLYLGQSVAHAPLVMAALAVIAGSPLLLWTTSGTGGRAAWQSRFLLTTERIVPSSVPALPSLRVVLGAAAAGAATSCCAAVIFAMTMHSVDPPGPRSSGAAIEIYLAWFLIPTALGVVVGAAVATARSSRAPLLAALVATQFGVWAGTAGLAALITVDGCIAPLATTRTLCDVRSGLAVPLREWLPLALVAGVLEATAATAVVLAIRRIPGIRARRPIHPRSDSIPIRRRLATASLFLAIAGVSFAVTVRGTTPSGSYETVDFGAVQQTAMPPASPYLLANQVAAWDLYSDDIGPRIERDMQNFADVAAPALESGNDDALITVRPECTDLTDLVPLAKRYFRNPDPPAESLWEKMINDVDRGSRECAAGFALLTAPTDHQGDEAVQHLLTAIGDFSDAFEADEAMLRRINTVITVPRP